MRQTRLVYFSHAWKFWGDIWVWLLGCVKSSQLSVFQMWHSYLKQKKKKKSSFCHAVTNTFCQKEGRKEGRVKAILPPRSFENSVEYGEERLEGPEGSKTPWDYDAQNQLSRAHRGSQRPKPQSQSLFVSMLGPLHKYYGVYSLVFQWD